MAAETTLYVNCTVHSMDPTVPRADALLVSGDTITAVGSRWEVEAGAPSGTRRIDLNGGTVVPGFNDSHAHVLWAGLALEQIDVGADATETVADIVQAVASRARNTPRGNWILGRGYDQNTLREARHPTRSDLDPVSPDHPVMLRHTSGHVLSANSLALRHAHIGHTTPDPPGGQIERDVHGEPTGVLKESAMELVAAVVPPPSHEAGVELIVRAVKQMASEGITSVSDAATGHGSSLDAELAMFRGALDTGHLAGRITLMPQVLYVAPPDTTTVLGREEIDAGSQPDWLHIGPVKIFSDGALSTRTAAVRQPYLGEEANTGILLWNRDTLDGMIRRAHAAGWQIATHALGDRAVETVVECYEHAIHAHPRPDHRHRIEHCMLLDSSLAARIKAAGVVPSLQPDIYRLGDGYVDALGFERAAQSIPVRLFADLNVQVAFSSDRPVIPGHPLEVMRSAIERRTPKGVILGKEHCTTAKDALRNYTVGGAYATHTEHRKGILKAGWLADFAVLSGDPTTTPLVDFADLHIVMTVAGGQSTYES